MKCLSCGTENPEGLEECSNGECQAILETPDQNLQRATRIAFGVALAFLAFCVVVIGILEPSR